MGGKRPDQYNIDPREARSTDKKSSDDDPRTHEQDVQNLAANPHQDQPLIPEVGVNPALRDLRERKKLVSDQDHE